LVHRTLWNSESVWRLLCESVWRSLPRRAGFFAILGVRLPLFTTSVHFAIKASLARYAMWLHALPPLRLDLSAPMGLAVAAAGMATAVDVACSNVALMYVSVTTYTIVKSSVPMWILAFSVCLGLRRLELRVLLVLCLILGGIVTTYVHPHSAYGASADGRGSGADARAGAVVLDEHGAALRVLGYVLVLTASLAAGLRWACSQVRAVDPRKRRRLAVPPLPALMSPRLLCMTAVLTAAARERAGES
jgi:drug/metabolite transporter (DMT)-like permease